MNTQRANMWKSGLLGLILLLSGCATSTGLIPAMPEELKKSNKDIDSVWREWKAPYVKAEDNRRNNAPDAEYIPMNIKGMVKEQQNIYGLIDITANTITSELSGYCVSHGGVSTVATCIPRNLYIQCADAQKNKVQTPAMLGQNSIDYFDATRYFVCRKGNITTLEVVVGRGTFHGSGLFVRTDSQQQRAKDRALSAIDMNDYHLLKNPAGLEHRKLYELVSRFEKKDDPENLIPAAREQLSQKTQENIAANKASKAAEEAAAVAANQMKRKNFLEIVNVGSLVCRSVSASVDIPTGLVIAGQPQTKRVQGRAKVTGYVNQRLNRKLQIQASAIHFQWLDDNLNSHEQELNSLDHYQGSSILRVNASIWESENDWEFCE